MCSSSFSFIRFKYFWPLIVISDFMKKSPVVPLIQIASHTITLVGCFIVFWVYFRHIVFLSVDGHFFAANCWSVDLSENKTFLKPFNFFYLKINHSFKVQSLCYSANCWHFFFIAWLGLGFLLVFVTLDQFLN